MPINLCFCIDENYVYHLGAVLQSLVESNKINNINIFVITSLVSNESKDRLRSSIEKASLFSIHFIDSKNTEIMDLSAGGHISSATYIRFELADLLGKLDKVIYLDSDIIILDDLSELWNTDISNYYVAAVENPFFNRYDSLGIKKSHGYFNAGVLLVNLNKWRYENIKNKAISFLVNYKDLCIMYDQDALNATLKGKWKKLPIRWNLQTIFLRKRLSLKLQKMEIKSAYKRPGIVHFSSSSKPWDFLDPHPLSSSFKKYQNTFGKKTVKLTIYNISRSIIKFFYLKIIYHFQLNY